ncbi:MAG: hypothetical protein ACXW4E_03845 [Anaerolineales bacterium]
MRKKIVWIIGWMFVFSAFLLTMYRTDANEIINYPNGMGCLNHTDHRFFERRDDEYHFYIREESADCSYICPSGVLKQISISGSVSSLYSASKADLDAQLCSVAPPATPTQPPATATPASSPTLAASPASTASPTLAASPTLVASPTGQASATAEITLTPQASLLTGGVTMCDTGGDLISFRIIQPPPDLTGKSLTAQIAEQESSCYVNATNPSIMTCTLPPGVTFPAPIVVSVDGKVASEFTYSGLGCAEITTPIATTTP